MSFRFSFTARDVSSAHAKLQSVHAPAAVKALIEVALTSVPRSQPVAQGRTPNTGFSDPQSVRTPTLAGILVEAQGHVDDSGGEGKIDRFLVQPLYD